MNTEIRTERTPATDWTLRPAGPDDVEPLIALLGSHVPRVSAQTVWQVPWTWQHYVVARAERDGELIAAGSLQPIGRGRAEIRGIVVGDAWRGERVGAALVECLIQRAQAKGLDAVCVTREPEFFRRFGFERTSPHWVDRHRQAATTAPFGPRFAMALLPEPAAC